jgi:hypothetical protein
MNGYNNDIDSIRTSYMALSDKIKYFEGRNYTTTILLYEYMDQYCKHNGIPVSAHFTYLNLASILA